MEPEAQLKTHHAKEPILLSGNQAIARAAIEAGVTLVTGYPGTPSTYVIETLLRIPDLGFRVEWAVNEKVAFELAAAAAHEGIAQRGGGVFGFVRLGEAYSPKIPLGKADVIVSLEMSEVVSALSYLKDQGEVWVNCRRVDGYHTKLRPSSYPSRERIEMVIRERTSHLTIIPADRLARETGSLKAANMVMLGAFVRGNSVLKSHSITWAIQDVSRRFASSNLGAFRKGRAFLRKEGAFQ